MKQKREKWRLTSSEELMVVTVRVAELTLVHGTENSVICNDRFSDDAHFSISFGEHRLQIDFGILHGFILLGKSNIYLWKKCMGNNNQPHVHDLLFLSPINAFEFGKCFKLFFANGGAWKILSK